MSSRRILHVTSQWRVSWSMATPGPSDRGEVRWGSHGVAWLTAVPPVTLRRLETAKSLNCRGRRESTNHVSQDYIRCQSSRPLFCWRMSLSFPSDPFIRLRQSVLPGVVKINSLSTVQYCSGLGLWKSVCNTVVKYESLCVLESWRIKLSIFKSEQRFFEGED